MSAPFGDQTGDHVHYHQDGTVWAKGAVINGNPEGYWEWFRKDGTLSRSGYYTHGQQTGEWTTYDKEGKVYKVTQLTTLEK